VQLEGSGFDPDGDTLAFRWDLTGGTNYTIFGPHPYILGGWIARAEHALSRSPSMRQQGRVRPGYWDCNDYHQRRGQDAGLTAVHL
jgi:hypothetical protein